MADMILNSPNFETLNRNRFFVRFPEESKIQGWWVQAFEKSSFFINNDDRNNNIIVIKFKEIDNWGDYRFVKEMKIFNELVNRTIIFEDLDKAGVVLNREYYKNCKATVIHFTPCDYNENSSKICTVIFRYEEVSDNLE